MGSVEAARMAAEDFAAAGSSIKVEIVYADHQNKADVGSAIVRKWLNVDGVDAVVDVPNSAVGLTINSLMRDTRMTFLASSTASSDLTGKACSPNTIQWVNDAWATGNTTAAAMLSHGSAGISSRSTTPSARGSRRKPPNISRPMAARCLAQAGTRSAPPISRRFCCKRKAPRPR